MDTPAEPGICLFDGFLFDLRVRSLFRLNRERVPEPVTLGSRAVDILYLLIEHGGGILGRQAIIESVWPNITVEESNLTVQISALRRVLDADRTEGSCIQTIPGRGYRFVPTILRAGNFAAAGGGTDQYSPPDQDRPHGGATVATEPALPQSTTPKAQRQREATVPWGARRRLGASPFAWIAVLLFLFLSIILSTQPWSFLHSRATNDFPRLSLVVLPLQNLNGNPAEDYLADAITDDLTTELSYIPDTTVVARESAYTYKGKATDVRQIGRDLGVRYVLEGSVRRLDATLRVNIQLISAETGLHVWSDRFDELITELADGQQKIVARMRDGLGLGMIDVESARSLRERPTNPDAFDLILRARAIRNLPESVERVKEALTLFERALLLDPSSVYAMTSVAYYLINMQPSSAGWGSLEDMERAESLLARAPGRAGISIRPQHVDLLAAFHGPLPGSDGGRGAGHSDGPKPTSCHDGGI